MIIALKNLKLYILIELSWIELNWIELNCVLLQYLLMNTTKELNNREWLF